MNRVLYILLAILPLMAMRCKDNDSGPPYHNTLPQELKDYAYFKEGSYWVYQDSASGVLDSVVVDSSSLQVQEEYGMEHGNKVFAGTSEVVFLIKRSETTGKTRTNVTVPIAVQRVPKQLSYYLTTFIGRSTYTEYRATILSYYPIVGDVDPSSGGTVSAFHDSLQIAGKWYYGVERFDDPSNITEDNYPTRFYHALNYGLVRKEVKPDNQPWKVSNLIRSKLKQ